MMGIVSYMIIIFFDSNITFVTTFIDKVVVIINDGNVVDYDFIVDR